MVKCENCGHEMSNDWANMVNQCPNCKEEVYKFNKCEDNDND